jgi:hypothetical protein
MAETTGLVQRLSISDTFTCVWVGPTANNTELLFFRNDGPLASALFASTLAEILASALTNYRAVVAIHGDNDAQITALRIDPV